ncbi:MAG: LPS export ABC transporter permease LptG [Kiloniellales bacterium]
MTYELRRGPLPRIRRLRLSPTLTGYIAGQFSTRFAGFFFGLIGVILLVSVIDLLDRTTNKEDVGFALVLKMAVLKLPHLSQETMVFTILFAGMATFWRLTRSHELVVARAAGVSVWQFLLPVIAVAALIGVLTVTVINPLSAVLLGRFEQLELRHLRHGSSMLAVAKTGLWLRQADEGGQSVIHAQRVSHETITLHDVIVFRYEGADHFTGRIDAPQAELRNGYWLLHDAWVTTPGAAGRFSERLELSTDLTPEKIQDSFARPETISFWSLPGFIQLLEDAGFSGQRHRLQLHRLLASPLLFAAMILIAATFSLRPQRRGRIGLIIISGIATGFLLHFLSNFVFALGLSSKIPVVLAGWTPAGVSLMLGAAMLLHLEDG